MAIRALRFFHVSHLNPAEAARITNGEALCEPGGDYESLHKQLKRLFNAKPGKRYGRFSEDIGEAPLSSWLKDYLEEKQTFERFSESVSGQLGHLFDNNDLEHEGPLLLVHETLADGEVIYLFALEQDSSLCLTGNLALDATDTLSLSRLNLAIRIEVDEWLREGGDNYLTFFKGRGTADWGDLFEKLVGFSNQVDVDKETQTFLDAVESFARESDDEQAQTVRNRAFEFCRDQSSLGEPVPIDALSSYIDESNPERFSEFVNESQSLSADTVLHPDQRKVRKLVRISGRGHGMSLSFSSDLVNQGVHYDPSQDALIITKLPKSLKEQLQTYLESKAEE
ncbi:nucleoid-associated protein [Marinobacteraceae bacterium S3BR75-40.1]